MKHLPDARGVVIGFICGIAVLPQSPFSTSSSRVETTGHGEEGARAFVLLLSPRSLVSASTSSCSVCGFAEPTLARPVGSESWLSMEREAHKRWNLLWKDGKWCKAPRVEIEAVRTICRGFLESKTSFQVLFKVQGLHVRMELARPSIEEFRTTPSGRRRRDDNAADNEREKEVADGVMMLLGYERLALPSGVD